MNTTRSLAVFGLAVLLGFSACGDGDNNNQPANKLNVVQPSDPANQPKAETPKVQPKTDSPTNTSNEQNSTAKSSGATGSDQKETMAKSAFEKTLAFGDKSWPLQNVIVQVKTFDGISRVEKSSWSSVCSSSKPLSWSGKYPNVVVSMGYLSCEREGSKPFATTELAILLNRLIYRVRHIPTMPTDPNQFRLWLVDADLMNVGFYRKWKEIKSLNGLARDHEVYFDLLVQEEGPLGWPEIAHYFVETSIREDVETKTQRLRVSMTINSTARSGKPEDSVELMIEATR